MERSPKNEVSGVCDQSRILYFLNFLSRLNHVDGPRVIFVSFVIKIGLAKTFKIPDCLFFWPQTFHSLLGSEIM